MSDGGEAPAPSAWADMFVAAMGALNALFRMLTWAVVAVCAMVAVAFVAGQETLVSLVSDVDLDINANTPPDSAIVQVLGVWTDVTVAGTVAFLVLLLGVACAAYLVQRGRNGRLIERFSPLVKARELQVDPDRTSAMLTDQGRTLPEDRRALAPVGD